MTQEKEKHDKMKQLLESNISFNVCKSAQVARFSSVAHTYDGWCIIRIPTLRCTIFIVTLHTRKFRANFILASTNNLSARNEKKKEKQYLMI